MNLGKVCMQIYLGNLNNHVVSAFLAISVLSGCATLPVTTKVPTSTTLNIIIATKAPASILIVSQMPTQVTNTIDPTVIATSAQGNMLYVVTSTSAPTITASGPMLDAKADNAQAFNKKAPSVIRAFKRVDTRSLTSTNGATMQFRTSDGTVYQVVLWITPSAQDALTRYQVETSPISARQTLNVGDEGIIAADGPIMAEVRYRNMVLIVYRPTAKGRTPRKPLTDIEITNFVTTLFKAIPQS